MAKEKDKVELRPVDEDADAKLRYVRLHKDVAEEVVELPPVKVGVVPTNARLDPATREELKIRSSDPDVGSLIERDIPATEEPWQGQAIGDATFPWGWAAVVACIFAIAILWSLVNVNNGEEKRLALADETLAILEKERSAELDAEAVVGTLEDVVRDFFDARSMEEMLRCVRHPDRVKPLMESYYAGMVPKAMRVERVLSLDPLTIENRGSFWMVACVLESGLQTQLLVEVLSEKEAKVDWETFVCYQPMAWDDFAGSRPGGYTGDFRVYVERDHFFSHEFSDPEKFDSYRLTALNGESVLFGYAPRGERLSQRIAEQVDGQGGTLAPMILRLHVPDGVSSPRGVVIREFLNPRWAYLEPPVKQEP